MPLESRNDERTVEIGAEELMSGAAEEVEELVY